QLGVAPGRPERTQHPVADGPFGDAVTNSDHDTGDLAARDVRRRGRVLIFALEHQRVGEDHRSGRYVDEELLGPGDRIVHRLDNQFLRWTERLAHDSLHAATLA